MQVNRFLVGKYGKLMIACLFGNSVAMPVFRAHHQTKRVIKEFTPKKKLIVIVKNGKFKVLWTLLMWGQSGIPPTVCKGKVGQNGTLVGCISKWS